MNFKKLKDKIILQLNQIGLKNGDTLLVRADLSVVGKLSRNRTDYVNVFLDILGDAGTLVALAFTGSAFIIKNKNYIFDGTNKANTGSFANIMLSHPKAIRSKHPTNSFVAIGQNAKFILNGHDHKSGAYEPIRKIIQLKGKMMLIGCIDSSPGFTTAHLAETDLGLHNRIILPKLSNCYYKDDDGVISLFRRNDIGGCSYTFQKFYAHYLLNNILQQGYIGNAHSILVDAEKAYVIEKEILRKNPKYNICDRPNCFLCRARRWDNLKDIPFFLIKKIYQKLVSSKN
jgi:aminoglycoside N3'-acetyltransferase